MSSQAVRSPRGNRKTVIIGFDFGTHSTKVVVRERGTSDGRIVQFDDVVWGYPYRASPSLVRLVGNRLFFGTEALTRRGGELFSSLKVGLLRYGDQNGSTFPLGLTNRTLVAAYLAWAFTQLRANLPEHSESKFFINVAAPMSHFEDPRLKMSYLQIVQVAWNLAFASNETPIHQGVSVSSAVEILSPLVEQPVLEPEIRRFDVLPETIAPVVSLSLDPFMEPGMYMIVDTGAGTTEMSVFHAGESGADQKVLCYQDETMLLGGNDVHLAEQLSEPEKRHAVDKILSKLKSQFRRLWYQGYQIDMNNRIAAKRWKELTVVLSGGGTRHSEIAQHLTDINPMIAWPKSETYLEAWRHIPGTLETDTDMDEDDASMFAVANGLAIERMHWPVVFQTHQIEPLAPTELVEEKPEAYWYV